MIHLLENRPMKCKLGTREVWPCNQEFKANKMVQHWREFHQMEVITKAPDSNDTA
jgi:hypothetical protein